MTPEFWAAIIGQTVIIVVSIVAAFVRTERRITRMETKVEHIEAIEAIRGKEHERLEGKVSGISRAVARLEGAHQACPYANTKREVQA